MGRSKKDILNGVTGIVSSKIVANNTVRYERETGETVYRLHDTDIITLKNGVYTLNSGGWRTVTTSERIERFSPARIRKERGVWYIGESVFYDGIQVNSDREVISKNRELSSDYGKMKRKIAAFIKLVTRENLPMPSTGDCWDCIMVTNNGDTLGDYRGNHGHLLSHIEEGYLPGALLVNAMRERGYSDDQIGLHYAMKLADTFKRALRKYLQKRLLVY